MRKLIVVAVASATFGGMIAALATAAIQSQASPRAIAAAVQKVQDTKSENELGAISSRLATIAQTLGTTAQQAHADEAATAAAIKQESHYQGLDASDIYEQLVTICRNTLPSPNFGPLCPFSLPPLR